MRCVVVVVKANSVKTVLRRAVIGRRDKRKGRRRGVNYTAKRSKQMQIRVVSTLRSILFECLVSSDLRLVLFTCGRLARGQSS